MIRHAARLSNIRQRSPDGRSAWERVYGRRFNREIFEFGERGMYLKPGSVGKDKLEPRWENGHFIGLQDEPAELLIGTDQGVLEVRSNRHHSSASDNGWITMGTSSRAKWHRDQVGC